MVPRKHSSPPQTRYDTVFPVFRLRLFATDPAIRALLGLLSYILLRKQRAARANHVKDTAPMRRAVGSQLLQTPFIESDSKNRLPVR